MEFKFVTFSVLLFVGCARPIIDNGAQPQELGKNSTVEYAVPDVRDDSLFTYKCDGKLYSIRFENHNWAYFPEGLTNCLSKESFKGNDETNLDLAQMIVNLGFRKFERLFDNSCNRMRGPQIFEAALVVGDDFSFIRHPTLGYPTSTVARATTNFLYKLIESIDGEKNVSEWACKIYEYNNQPCFRTIKPVEVDVEDHKLRFYTLRKLWKEGKIKLKPYGQQ